MSDTRPPVRFYTQAELDAALDAARAEVERVQAWKKYHMHEGCNGRITDAGYVPDCEALRQRNEELVALLERILKSAVLESTWIDARRAINFDIRHALEGRDG